MIEQIQAQAKSFKILQLRLMESFKDRGKYDTIFNWDRQSLTLTVDMPNNKIAAYGRMPSKIAVEICYLRYNTIKLFLDFGKYLSDKEEYKNSIRLISLDMIGFDFCIFFPQIDGKTIYFRFSMMEFCPTIPTADKCEKPILNCLCWSCEPPDKQMYAMPKTSFLDQFTWIQLSVANMIYTLKRMFPLYYLLGDIHFKERCVNRHSYSMEHMKLFRHFYNKTFNYTILCNQSRRTNSKSLDATIRVVIEDGDMEVVIIIIRDNDVRFKIFDHNRSNDEYREREIEFYKDMYENFVRRWPSMKEVLIFEEFINRETNKKETRFAVKLQKIEIFEMVLLAVYQLVHFRMEIEILKNKAISQLRVVKSAVAVTKEGYELVIQHCLETSEHVFQTIKPKNQEQTKFIQILIRYISQHLNVCQNLINPRQNYSYVASLPGLLQDLTKKYSQNHSKNPLVSFLELFKNLDETYKKLQPIYKQNVIRLFEKLVSYLMSQMASKPNKTFRWLIFEQTKDGTLEKPIYEITFRSHDFNMPSFREKANIKVRTDFEDVWSFKMNSGESPEKKKNKYVKRIQDIKSFGKDLMIGQFIL